MSRPGGPKLLGPPLSSLSIHPTQRGLTLLEVTVAILVITIAITASLGLFVTHVHGSHLAQQRRLAVQTALAKVDEMRLALINGNPSNVLEGIFASYGPLPASTGGPKAVFVVGEDANKNGILDQAQAYYFGEDLNNNGVLDEFLERLPGRPLGTVTIITDETPNEGDFGFVYGMTPVTVVDSSGRFQWHESTPFGVDINQDGNYSAQSPSPLSPFPLDINGDGDTLDVNVTSGFAMLPVVVTIQWRGPQKPERVDVFTILVPPVR